MFRITRTRQIVSLAFVLALSIIIARVESPAPVLSQANSCTALVSQVIQDARAVCSEADRGKACVASSGVNATFQSGTAGASFAKPGDLSPVAGLHSIVSPAVDPNAKTWGMALLKLRAGLAEDSESALTMAVLGDAKLTNAVDPSAKLPTSNATNRNKGSLNIFAGPGTDRPVIGTLASLEKVTANGRTDNSDWVRIERNGKLGWIRTQEIALDNDIASLLPVQESDVTALYREPMQSFALQTGDAASCKDAPNGVLIQSPVDSHATILVNGVQLDSSGAAFLTAPGGSLIVTGLQGRLAVTASGKTVTVSTGQTVTVPTDGQAAKGQPSDPKAAEASSLPDLLNSLINGQPYGQPTTANFAVATGDARAFVGQPVRVNMSFTGDASTCPAVKESAPLDVSLVIDASDNMSGAQLAVARSAVIDFVKALSPDKDQAGVVAFNSKSVTLSAFGQRLNTDKIASLSTLQPGSATAIQVGLASGLSQLKQSKRADTAIRAVVLILGTNGDPDALKNIVSDIKNSGVRLIVVAVGKVDQKALAGIVGSQDGIVAALNATDIRSALDRVRLSLTRPVAARDVTLNYTIDTSRFQLVEEVLAASGGTKVVDQNAVTARWSIPTVWATQTVNFPLVVRPLKDGAAPIGTARFTYTTCADGANRVTTSPMNAPSVTVAAAPSTAQQKVLANANAGALAAGDSGSGTLSAFGQQAWLLDLQDNRLFSVVTQGTKQPISAVVSGDSPDPLYALENFDGKGNNLTVFSLPQGGPHWLYLSSQSANAAGSYTVTINAGPTLDPQQALTVDGERIQDRQSAYEGHIYGIVGAKGDGSVLTFHYKGEEPIDPDKTGLPIKIVSLDGNQADELYTKFDKDNNQWITVQALRGAGSYFAVVKSDDTYSVGVESDDTLTNDRGTLKIGETRRNQSREDTKGTFKYKLDVPSDKRFSVVLSGTANTMRLVNAAEQTITAASEVNTNGFRIELYDLKTGPYTLYLETDGDFDISLSEGNIVSAVKGSLGIGQTLEEELQKGDNLAAYRLVTTATNPLQDGHIITVNLTAAVDNLGSGNVFIESANGVRSQVTQDFVDKRGAKPQLISVQELKGKGPYRIQVTGADSYTIRVDRGDLLSNDKGDIVDGQEVRDSSRAPEVLFYNLAPELGRELGEGDIITIGFTPQLVSDEDFKSVDVLLQNGDKQEIPSLQSYTFKRQFVKVFQLIGQGPYRLGIPNIGAYVLDFNIGNKLVLDQGKFDVGKTLQGRTDGPQLVQYTFDGHDKQTVTIKIKDTRKQRSDFNARLTNADGDAVRPKWAIDVKSDGLDLLVYTLKGAGPYQLSFEMDGIYELTISQGDALTLFKGNFFIGDAETGKVEDDTKLVTYLLPVKANQTISIQITTFFFLLRDPNGDLVPSSKALYVSDNGRFGRLEVFNLREAGNYELSFPQFGDYTIRVWDGDQLTVNKGNFYLGNTETDKLDNNKSFVTYTINGHEGQTLSLRAEINDFKQVSNGNLNLTQIQIVSSKGDISDFTEEITDPGYILRMYALRGPGPYTLTFSPQRSTNKFAQEYASYPQKEYKLTLLDRDDLNISRGTIALDKPISDMVKDGKRKVFYTFTPDQGNVVTLEIEQKNARGLIKSQLEDANGKLIPASATNFDKNTSYASYTLDGAVPYRASFDIVDDYTVTVASSDLLQTSLGSLTAGTPATNKLAAPAMIAGYTVDAKEGDVVSIQLQQQGSTLVGKLTDAAGNVIPSDVQYLDKGSSLFIYQLQGTGPYQLSFKANNNAPHTVTLAGPDVLNAKLGDLTINPANSTDPKFKPVVVKNKLTAPARVAIYNVPANEGDVITLALGQNNQQTHLEPHLVASDGKEIEPPVKLIDKGTAYGVYKAQGAAPYTLSFETTSDYTVTLTQGDVLRADAGPMPIGKQDKPFTNTLKPPALIAVHSLDVAPGQVITVQLENSGRKIIDEVRDGTGKVLQPEVRDFQQGRTNVSVYILSGSAPYTLSFPASGQYTATVYSGNLIRFDGGIAPFDKTVSATIQPPSNVSTYTVDGKRDQIVTIQIKGDGKDLKAELRDANGKLWLPQIQFTKNGMFYSVYLLSGPAPYSITFGSLRYDLTVSQGNVLRATQGDLQFDQKVTNTLKPPATTAIYTFTSDPGGLVSIQIKQGGRAIEPEMRDANGKILRREAFVKTKTNSTVAVYTLSGPGPYSIEFSPDSQCDLTLTKGNALRADLGTIAFGQQVKNTLPDPAQTAIYTVDAKEAALVSVALQVGSKPAKSTLYNGNGDALKPQAQIEKNNSNYAIYTLSGPAPYTLEFPADNQYQLTVSTGNVIRADKGVIRFGNTETDQLTDPQGVAIYTIDGQPGQTISLKLQDRNQPADSQVRSADGNLLQPWGEATANNATYTIYALSGPAPYTVTFVPGGKYSLTLTQGSVFDSDQGVIPFGQTVTNTLQTPVRVAVYTLNTASDQVISAELVNKGQGGFIKGTLRDANSKVIDPQSQLFDGTTTVTTVYTLVGPGPYKFTFESTSPYSLTFMRGDASITKFKVFATPTMTPTPMPAPEQAPTEAPTEAPPTATPSAK